MAWWLNGSAPDCCPAVRDLNLASPQLTADCQSPGGLPPGMALGCGLNSGGATEEKITKNEQLVCKKHKKEKKHVWIGEGKGGVWGQARS